MSNVTESSARFLRGCYRLAALRSGTIGVYAPSENGTREVACVPSWSDGQAMIDELKRRNDRAGVLVLP